MPKKRSLAQNKFSLYLYLFIHLALILACVVMAVFSGGLNIQADLFSMMPDASFGSATHVAGFASTTHVSSDVQAKRKADALLAQQTSNNVIVLVSSADFALAKKTAVLAYEQLKDSPHFTALSLYADAESMNDIMELLHEYRFQLLDDAAVEMIARDEGAQRFAGNALAKAYGVFTLSDIERLEEDPFLFDDYNLQNYLSMIKQTGISLSPKDGVLAAFHDDAWYVMLSGRLSKSGAALASRKNGIAEIYAVCNALEKNGVRFVYSGTPFHSYKSSTEAAREIAVISILSFVLVVSLLVAVFRSPLPIFASGASILVSCATGFAATYIVFGSIHVLALVFATSLVGCCIDYSLHFFINWKARRKQSYRGLSLSFLSTEISFVCLYLAPFNLLKQIAVFCFFGILSAFLITVFIYPLFPMPKKDKNSVLKVKNRFFERKRNFKTSMVYTLLILVGALAVLYVNRGNLKVRNNISRLYTLEGRLKDDALITNAVLKYAPTAWFIVSGNSTEDVLELEEDVCKELREIHKNTDYGFVATSMFIPSIKKQKKSLDAVRSLLPYAESQYESLGYDRSFGDDFRNMYAASESSFLTPEDELPSYMQSLISSLWLGQVGERYYSIILPSIAINPQAYRHIADSYVNVMYADKVSDIGKSLDYLTKIVFVLFAVAYFIIIVVLSFFYSWRHVIKIASVPVLCVSVITAVFCATGNSIDFFALIGIVLVFGLGLDYIIYILQDKVDRRVESFAVLLSFLTTALSFCTLAFSSFVPVHIIGLAIFAGLTVAFVATLF